MYAVLEAPMRRSNKKKSKLALAKQTKRHEKMKKNYKLETISLRLSQFGRIPASVEGAPHEPRAYGGPPEHYSHIPTSPGLQRW